MYRSRDAGLLSSNAHCLRSGVASGSPEKSERPNPVGRESRPGAILLWVPGLAGAGARPYTAADGIAGVIAAHHA